MGRGEWVQQLGREVYMPGIVYFVVYMSFIVLKAYIVYNTLEIIFIFC